jgi:flagellar biosynthetic protein FliR
MPWELLATTLKLPVFALVASRLGGLLMFQPVLGALAVPINLRVLLVLGLAAMVTPLVSLPADAPVTPLGIALAMATEILLGGLIGLVGVACFLGLQWGGLLVAQESGLAFGKIVDPNSEEQETVVGVFYVQLAAVIYLVIGGHRMLVAACLDTFEAIPLLTDTGVMRFGCDLVFNAMTLGVQVAMQVAAPALVALFLVNLALGFVSRTMPQLNVLAVGFSLKAMLAFLIMAVALPSAADAFIGALETAYAWIHELMVV